MRAGELEQPPIVDRADLQLAERDRQRRLLAQRHERARQARLRGMVEQVLRGAWAA